MSDVNEAQINAINNFRDLQIDLLIKLLIITPVIALFYGLISGLSDESKIHSLPNKGIWNSLHNQAWITIIIFLCIILIIQSWEIGVSVALNFGFSMGGGKACLQHLSLRIVLWQSGLPWNFARFLNYCVERRLLLRVGGSYRFLHRELLDHFAQSNH